MTSPEATKDRLTQAVQFLEELDKRRQESNLPLLGYHIESLFIARELRELEEDVLRDPGALGPYLVRARGEDS